MKSAGCSAPPDAKGAPPTPPNTPAKAEKGAPYRIALVMKSLANEFFLTMENGARAHQKAHAADYDLLVNGIKDELDVSRQIDLVEQMTAQKVDALVIAPADSKALVTVLKRAKEAGILVVNVNVWRSDEPSFVNPRYSSSMNHFPTWTRNCA